MKISKFDKATLTALRCEMSTVLEKYGIKAGVEFEVGNMRFSEAEVDIKVKAKVKGVKTRTDAILEMAAKNAGITNLQNSRGEKLVGYNSRSYKYPFIYETSNGKKFKCTEQSAKIKFA